LSARSQIGAQHAGVLLSSTGTTQRARLDDLRSQLSRLGSVRDIGRTLADNLAAKLPAA
jgi:hypothetical protein